MIPVIDIKDGKAVSGRLGERDGYVELESVVCDSSDPFDVASTYQELGFTEVYISDLDGITESKPNLDVLTRIVELCDLSVILDLGVWEPDMIFLMEQVKPVIASEAFSSINLVEFPGPVVLSMTFRNGVLLSGTAGDDLAEFIDLMRDSTRINEIIVMDLGRFEVSAGPNIALCKKLVENLPRQKIIYGGGVRGLKDIYLLRQAGVDRVLIGAALHSGTIFRDG